MYITAQAVHDYLAMLEFERNLSKDTLKAYRIDLQQFLHFTEGRPVDRNLLSQYVALLNRTYQPRTTKRKLASVRAFFTALTADVPDKNPFLHYHARIATPQPLPRIIPEQLVGDLLESVYSAYDPARPSTLRDILVMELLFGAGVRVSELCSLTRDTFQLSPRSLRLHIHGKGSRDRVIELTTPALLQVAAQYCRLYEKKIDAVGTIFTNRRRRPLSPASVRQIIQNHLNQVGSQYHVTPHMFRHTRRQIAHSC